MRRGNADYRPGVRTVRGVGARTSSRNGGTALGCEQLGEVGADDVDPGLALCGRRDGRRRWITSYGRVDEWHGVGLDVRACCGNDLPCPRRLSRIARNEFQQRQSLPRERGTRLFPLGEELRLVRENEPALPRLDVEHEQFEPIGSRQHILRMQRAALGVSRILNGAQKGGEHATDDEREGHRSKDHPLPDSAPRPDRATGCVAIVRAAAPTPSHAATLLTNSGRACL